MQACRNDKPGKGASRKGRPVQMDPGRREALVLDTVEELVAERGFHRTTMDAVARHAGMSKRTLYNLFSNRDALFNECILRKARTFVLPLRPEQRELPLAERLNILLAVELPAENENRSIEMLRAAIGEARHYPQLSDRILTDGVKKLECLVTGELRIARERGEIDLAEEDCARLAAILVDAVHENPLRRLLSPAAGAECAGERAWRRQTAIRLFLAGLTKS